MPDLTNDTLFAACGDPVATGTRIGGRDGHRRWWGLYQSGSVEFMRSMPGNCVDVVFADPPYFVQGKRATTNRSGKRAAVAHGEWDRPIGGPDAELQFHRRWLHEARRVLRPTGTIWACGNYKSIGPLLFALQCSRFRLLNVVSWFKPNATPNLGRRQLTHSQEFLAWASCGRDADHFFDYRNAVQIGEGKQLRDMWKMSARLDDAETLHGKHPTQKPVALLDRVMAISAPAEGMVLDPFCGSGTAGVAALAYGARYVGIDLNANYLDIAAKRLGS